jgi:hypothetical protein
MVWELERMPITEYLNWIKYMEEKARSDEADSGNLLAMDDNDMIGAMTGG